jgi:hypothetical protein
MLRHHLTMTVVLLSVAAVGTLLAPAALAVEWKDYAEFQHTSALPGNGYAVNENGQVGFLGAFHMNVPCAYTPCSGNYAACYYSGSNDSALRFSTGGINTDSTGMIGLGFGKPGAGLYLSETFVESRLSVNCFNFQWQLHDETRDVPAIAVGVLDILDQREARLGEPHGARSFYITMTRKVTSTDTPVYTSLGFGSGRFEDRPFGAVSWFPTDWAMLGFEYDGRMPRPHGALNVYTTDKWNVTGAIGWSNFERPVVGFNITYSD